MNNTPLGQSDFAKINEKISEYHAFISHNDLILDSLWDLYREEL